MLSYTISKNSSFTSWLKNPQECKRHALPLLPPHLFPPDSSLAPPPPLPPPPLPPLGNPSTWCRRRKQSRKINDKDSILSVLTSRFAKICAESHDVYAIFGFPVFLVIMHRADTEALLTCTSWDILPPFLSDPGLPINPWVFLCFRILTWTRDLENG